MISDQSVIEKSTPRKTNLKEECNKWIKYGAKQKLGIWNYLIA